MNKAINDPNEGQQQDEKQEQAGAEQANETPANEEKETEGAGALVD